MKLSEAIRLGAMLSEPARNGRMNGNRRCALAAASDAAGIPPVMVPGVGPCVSHDDLVKRFPILSVVVHTPFRSWWSTGALLDAIWLLNDFHRWSREQIADWVETIEAQQEPRMQPLPETESVAV
jgi:hypothetical protein